MTGRRAVGIGLLVAGLATMTLSELFLRDPVSSPAFRDGQWARDRAGHTARELFADGVGVILTMAGAILLISRRDGGA